MASIEIKFRVKTMQNKWNDIVLDDKDMTGADLMSTLNFENSLSFIHRFTMINRATFKKLDNKQSAMTQIKSNSEWEIIPIPMSSCGGGACKLNTDNMVLYTKDNPPQSTHNKQNNQNASDDDEGKKSNANK
eukprot:155981_1